jgi:hypothetical protein
MQLDILALDAVSVWLISMTKLATNLQRIVLFSAASLVSALF